jgi:DNA-directed RNA polymerase subunit RPC12/RpoP
VQARFCVRCGTKLVRRKIEKRLRPVCPNCGHIAFRNAKPAVGLLIERKGVLLLVRRARAPFEGYWDIPGGFLEEDEDAHTGARREARSISTTRRMSSAAARSPVTMLTICAGSRSATSRGGSPSRVIRAR